MACRFVSVIFYALTLTLLSWQFEKEIKLYKFIEE